MKDKIEAKVNIKNRRASHEYEFLEIFSAGIMLRGTEIKSIRQGKVQMQDAFCAFKTDGLYLVNMHISIYEHGTYLNHIPKSDRKLLLNKTELKKINKKMQEKGITTIPIRVFINDRGFAKVEIAVSKGKKLYDKREDLKEKDTKREMDRFLKI